MAPVKLNRRQVVMLLILLLVGAAIGIHIYELQELRGLRARVHTLEYKNGEEYAYYDETSDEKVDYEVLSKTTKNVRVEDLDNYKEETDETTYTTEKMYIYHIRITNNTSYAYEYTESDFRGKTKTGSLIYTTSLYGIHPDDRMGKDSFGLAPGGSQEVYVYIPADEEIVDLYFTPYGSV